MEGELWLVAGLGNPGSSYARTRHNVGYMAAETLAQKCKIAINQNKFKAWFGRGRCGNRKIIIAKPSAYMNRSGPPLRQLADYFNVSILNTLVIHDDLDIEKGQIKIKEKGGHGGHNGIKSIMETFGSGDFPRVRIGIGRPSLPVDVTDWVLGKFTKEEEKFFAPVIENASQAVITLIEQGLPVAMNRFNQRQIV